MGGAFLLRALRLTVFTQTNQVQILAARTCCSQNALIGNAGQPKVEKISRSVKMYLERARKHEEFTNEQNIEFEIGKRHLANMMGLDPENISQEEIDIAISYLLPSGLFNKQARPKLKPPVEILPKFEAAKFGIDGRPYSSFFYTSRPILCEKLHLISMKIEKLKAFEDNLIASGKQIDHSNPLILSGSTWKSKVDLEGEYDGKISPQEYTTLISSLEHLSKMPTAHMEEEFIKSFRNIMQNQALNFERKEPTFAEDGRGYIMEEGARKKAKATVKMFVEGKGKITINGEDFLTYFPQLIERQMVLSPLHILDKLLRVDIEAEVTGGGHSGQAGAIRLGIARALKHIVTSEEAEKLRLAGVLTKDPRILERMKPGQAGARKKFTWKKR